MIDGSPATEEIDIDEAMRLTGKSRRTLMRWIDEEKLTARTEIREHTQRQRRLVFKRDEVLKVAGHSSVAGEPNETTRH